MISEETYELIERYFRNELSAEELLSFTQRLKSDPGFAQEVEIHRQAEELLIDQGVLQMKQKLKQIRIKEEKGGFSQWKIYLNTAAVAILVIAGVFYFMKDDSGETVSPEEKKSVAINQEQKISSSEKVITPSTVKEQSEQKEQRSTVTSPTPGTNTTIPDEVVSDPLPSQNIQEQRKDTSHTTEAVKTPKGIVDCATIKITGEVDVKASCVKKSTGNILINSGTIKGGLKPYQYSISGEEEYTVSSYFYDLSAGHYKVFVKDKNGCKTVLASVEIVEENCPEEYAFAPSRGEEWAIPLKQDLAGEIKIMNRSGEIVYSLPFQSGATATWNGTDKNSLDLSAGVYLFLISYANGEVVKGHVTILR